MTISLRDYQIEAISKMKNGCILNGGTGSGKSRTALAYYYILNGGKIGHTYEEYVYMDENPMDLYIITTATKRDRFEWELEFAPFLLGENSRHTYNHKVIVDSWNNVKKYVDVKDAFFIFDEHRAIGSGTWAKSFMKIAKKNLWIILSATPGDTWKEYIPVFIANGFYKNRTEFYREHCIFSRYTNFPKIERYINTGKLLRLKKSILVPMDFERKTKQIHNDIWCEFDSEKYKRYEKERYDEYKDKPIETAGEFCHALRRVVNSDESRKKAIEEIVEVHNKSIIFYNYNFELDILKSCDFGKDFTVAEWNGKKHDKLPTTDKWVYLVQYTAGCEGWNCTSTDTIIFYSQNYSYKVMVQASGRIDRINTKYDNLYYYHLKSKSKIDTAITRALRAKKEFNESDFFMNKKAR